MEHPQTREAAANPTHSNIDAVAALEHDALGRRTATERVSDLITKVVGNIGFLVAQLALIAGWSAVNLHLIPSIKAFDPFPFGVLSLIISTEGVFPHGDGRADQPGAALWLSAASLNGARIWISRSACLREQELITPHVLPS